ALLQISPASLARSMISTVLLAPASSVSRFQATCPACSRLPSLDLTRFMPAGTGLAICTLVAAAVPGLLTVIRYFTGRFTYCRFAPVLVSFSLAASAGGCFSGGFFSGGGCFSGGGGSGGGSLNSGTAAPGTGTERTMRVVTHWPCSNCTRAQFLM